MTEQELAEKIKHLFIDENNTLKETAEKLHLSLYKIRKIKDKYNIQKDKALFSERCKKSAIRTKEEQEAINEKRKETNIKKYGVEYNWQSEKTKEKIKKTLKERYGTDNLREIDEINERRKRTCMERYGGETPFHSQVIQEKATETLCGHYGRRSSTTRLSPKAIEVFQSKENFRDFLLSIPEDERTLYEIEKRLEYSGCLFYKYYHKYELEDIPYKSNGHSIYEYEIFELITSWGIKVEIGNREILNGLEIDLYLPDHNLGIEFNGNYWHCDIQKPKNYHQEKTIKALQHNIFLYHIWENEWLNENKKQIIISQIRNLVGLSEKIYARKTVLKEILAKDCHKFLDENHLQGFRSSSKYYGLYYNDELVSCMTFGKNFLGKTNDMELLRFCNKKGVTIVGGASKLFKNFLKEHSECNKIISYCNLSKGKGDLYLNLGMKYIKITSPNYFWTSNSGEILSRYSTQMKNEDIIMKEKGYMKNYDCGNLIFVLERK